MTGEALRPGLRIRLLGALRVEARGASVALPPSRKVRALLGYLLLTPHPVPREKLCDLLWDVADDPRAELRWCLAKLRNIVDSPETPRLLADRERVGIDIASLDVDALRVARAIEPALAGADIGLLRDLVAEFGGDLLEGLSVERNPAFDTWLLAERQRFARWHARALTCIAAALPDGDEGRIETFSMRLALTPLDPEAHLDLLAALLRQGRKSEADQVLASALRMCASEGLDPAPLRQAYARARPTPSAALTRPVEPAAGVAADPVPASGAPARRAGIVVMPFASDGPPDSLIAEGLGHDVTLGLAKLRSLLVIARGTALALRDRAVAPGDVAALLQVDYVASGEVRSQGERLMISVELAAVPAGHIVWTEDFAIRIDAALDLIGTISGRIISGIDQQIQVAERNRALLRPPASLDAWQLHHRGLWHAFRFTAADNAEAESLFRAAVSADPTFSRAYAGLSFTHWQNVFQFAKEARGHHLDRAFEAAGRAIESDPLDPAAHWSLGRAFWLMGDDANALSALRESVELSPNFAMGHYSLAFVQAQTGDPELALAAADTSCRLSPLDPMLFAFHGARTFGLLRLGRHDEAAEWAQRAVQQRNAHVHIHAITALTLAATGRLNQARREAESVRRQFPGYGIDRFLSTFRLEQGLADTYRRAARAIGLG